MCVTSRFSRIIGIIEAGTYACQHRRIDYYYSFVRYVMDWAEDFWNRSLEYTLDSISDRGLVE
jgi:hypothetical protein